MASSTPNSLSPGEDTVARWIDSIPDADLMIDTEIRGNGNSPSLLSQDHEMTDISNGNFHLLENAQRFTTQDLMIPDCVPSTAYPQIDPKNQKRQRADSAVNQKGGEGESKSIKIPAWVRAEDALRTSLWNRSKTRKILKTRYVVPQREDELTCYHLTDAKTPFFVRILCAFFNPQKITIGAKGQINTKCEFSINQLDNVISALTSITKGSKSKTIHIGKRGEKLKFEMSNGSLNISQLFSPTIKKYAQKNNLGVHLSPEDSHFYLPASEIDLLLDSMLEALQFKKITENIASQRQRIFEDAVEGTKSNQSMSLQDFAVTLFQIYYKMNLDESVRYPVSIVLPEYHKTLKGCF